MQEKLQKLSPIKQRILKLIDYMEISKREFYAKTGISRGTLESSTGITEETMAKVFAVYRNINPEWLLTGKGEMIRENCFSYGENDENSDKNISDFTSEYRILSKDSRKNSLLGGELSNNGNDLSDLLKVILLNTEMLKEKDEQISRLLTLIENMSK